MPAPLSATSTLTFDLLGLTPQQRVDFYRTLDEDQLAGLWRCASRDLGTPYGLWADDPVGFWRMVLRGHPWSKQRELASSVESDKRTVSPASHSVGKGLALDTPVPTPTGWSTMGSLRVGDVVYGHDGEPCEVLAAHETRHLACWRVSFEDGESIVCDEDHLWTTHDFLARGRVKARARRRGEQVNWTDRWDDTATHVVGDIARSLAYNGQLSHRIPLSRPLSAPDAELPIDPYTFGLWLGDGTSSLANITTADPEVAEHVAAAGIEVRWTYPKERTPFFGLGASGGDYIRRLRALGVLNNKHIPTLYQRASVTQREGLLAGLLDSDGYTRGDIVEITLTNRALALDAYELVVGLGFKARIRESRACLNGRDCGPRWRIIFRPTRQVFRLSRKADRLQLAVRSFSRSTARSVVAIDRTVTVPTRCIQVSDKRGVFLAGRGMIPTHNTYGAAALACWFGCVHPPDSVQIVTTAPKFRQVKHLLWPHIHSMHAKNGLPGTLDQVQWKIGGKIIAYGFSASDYDEDAVQGIHAEHLLIVVDEAGGISHTLGKALESITSGAHTRLLAIGNPPTDEEGSWFEERTQSPLWNTVRISWTDTPNYVRRNDKGEIVERSDEHIPDEIARNLVDESWVDDQIVEFGPDSTFVEARVYARFPHGSTNKTIPWSWIEAATENDEPDESTWVRLGVDAAADGGDEFAIARAVGNDVTMVHSSSGAQNANPTDVAGKALLQIQDAELIRQSLGEKRKVRVKVDAIGVGWAVAGLLRAWGKEGIHDAEIVDVVVSEKANDAKKFSNKRAEMWWAGREMVRPRVADPARGIDGMPPIIRLDVDKRCAAQLNAPTYGHDSQGRIKIEKKDEIKKRGLGSPDRGEAVLLCLYEPEPLGVGVLTGSQIADTQI